MGRTLAERRHHRERIKQRWLRRLKAWGWLESYIRYPRSRLGGTGRAEAEADLARTATQLAADHDMGIRGDEEWVQDCAAYRDARRAPAPDTPKHWPAKAARHPTGRPRYGIRFRNRDAWWRRGDRYQWYWTEQQRDNAYSDYIAKRRSMLAHTAATHGKDPAKAVADYQEGVTKVERDL